ncbi:uncharacterized protein MONBRDRAFT_35345 [Monosiga brevicollis MX1]|uniref:Cystatin domain-containing protein n=1 Tax=Monosiga brevicollis TaxID=81824 RepID=A9UPJ1_MONBE|nr:uncharacterized protein MONBRDRAFT_35345 [Monosiga brevicollis MX1]EDQ92432.1 predicted protein [Monosiga brevicollis MX1]|eukprot:XP_001742194.1 hypothetical protein [Monosiga brevicollis MX1]
MAMVGGFGAPRDADEEIQQVADAVKSDVVAKIGKDVEQFKAIQVSTQVVAGTNYLIKVDVGSNEFVHIKVFRSLPPFQHELKAVETGKGATDALSNIE